MVLLGDSSRPRARSRSCSMGSEESVHTINESNQEVIDIRISRHTSAGCTCRAVKVDKLSVTKLKQELISHIDKIDISVDEINALPKAKLASAVREMLQSCPMCVTNNCSCVQEGIGCHPEVCSCFKHKNHQECENKYNEECYSSRSVDDYRKRFITSSIKQRTSTV